MKRSALILLLFVLFISCEIFLPPADGVFGIYMLKDKSLTICQNQGDAYLTKALDSIPVLTDRDIDFYDWSAHCIYLKTDKDAILDRVMDSSGRMIGYPGAPFIVATGGEAQYYGFFYSLIMSIAPLAPHIDEMGLKYYPDDILPINASWDSDEGDTRDNEVVKQALIDAGLFHAGIELELDTNHAVTFYAIDDTSMGVDYTYTITNHDQDALYILDPDKVVYHTYFYFNVQPSFRNTESGTLYRWENPSGSYDTFLVEPWDNLTWYTLLQPGSSMTRTIHSGSYPILPEGQYEFTLGYGSPIFTLDKASRNKVPGRIWIGQLETPVYTVNHTP